MQRVKAPSPPAETLTKGKFYALHQISDGIYYFVISMPYGSYAPGIGIPDVHRDPYKYPR